MDPFVKSWMFHSWAEDTYEKIDILRHHAILGGSFFNPEAAKKMLGKSGEIINLTDEEFEQSFNMIVEEREKDQEQKQKNKRRRKRIMNG